MFFLDVFKKYNLQKTITDTIFSETLSKEKQELISKRLTRKEIQ